jgi:recombination protein RecT
MTTKQADTIENKPAIQQPTQSERFTNMVVKEFTSGVGNATGLTAFHKRLCQNYFIHIDGVLKKAESSRLKKDEKYRDKISFIWENVNLNQLALDVVAAARIGLDPAQPNHINMIPYKNNSTNKYDIGFIPGYRGMELKAKKYGLDIPDDVIVELVYSTDKFKQIKKDINNQVESYQLEVTNNFDRGEIIGGFYYHSFKDNPKKNKLRVLSLHDIEKRKPEYASVEFWGGEKDKWVKDETGKNKKDGKEHVEGWFEEMCYKTIFRAAFNSITIDSQKIDDDFLRLSEKESEFKEQNSQRKIEENANKENISFTECEEVRDTVEQKPKAELQSESSSEKIEQQVMTGPGF